MRAFTKDGQREFKGTKWQIESNGLYGLPFDGSQFEKQFPMTLIVNSVNMYLTIGLFDITKQNSHPWLLNIGLFDITKQNSHPWL